MPNKPVHLFFAFLMFLGAWFLLDKFGLGYLHLYSALIFLGAVLPDFLDPPGNWSHRKFFHSRRLFKVIAIAAVVAFVLGFSSRNWFFVSFSCLGYISHLLLDLTTPAGLPY
ncbi:hypothetical protein COS75_00805 [Candidatus Pacearchaeota archaeon CG06_land_8_20_14_3_00_35_12]|nr:MAG: hypothetical protein COS75_00805 [Candidatus Pacearchaeota archaeon CG06_land_8_20_14_3_00_35_12]